VIRGHTHILVESLNVQTMTQAAFEWLAAILSWAVQFQRWQKTHLLKDTAMPFMETRAPPVSDACCCICFENKAPQRDPCSHCGSAVPVCESCLDSWSWAAGSVKQCVVCRSEDRRASRNRRPLDLHLQELSPFTCLFMISAYIFLHYSWLVCCYRIATSPSRLF